MKSLLISSNYFPPQIGGISQYMDTIVSTLGPDRVCCLTGVPGNRQAYSNGFRPRVYRCPGVFAQPKYIQAVRLCMVLTQIMMMERPQMIQLATAGEGYLGLWLHRWLKLPYVIYAYGNEILHVLHSDWQKPRLALHQAGCILAISKFTANLLQQDGVNPNRIEVVYPGCAVDRFRPLSPKVELRRKLLGSRYKDRVILTVGNLVTRKGHDMVIRALRRVSQTIPDTTYLIVGDGPHRMELETLASAVGVRDRVVFAGRVSPEELPDIYALCDVFVMPSREQLEVCDVEGFGLVFLEANACGKPVIGGRSGGITEAVMEGVTGLLVNPHDPDDIAHTLIHTLANRELATRMGQQGRLRVVRDFDSAHVGDRVERILESVLREALTSN